MTLLSVMFRISVNKSACIIECCDIIIQQAEERFDETENLECFNLVDPKEFSEMKCNFPEDLCNSSAKYYPFIEAGKQENELRIVYASEEFKNINSVSALYSFIIENDLADDFSETLKLSNIVLTTPVATAESERCFSTLKRVKTYLRNKMGQDRLNTLAMLTIEKEYIANIADFNKKSNNNGCWAEEQGSRILVQITLNICNRESEKEGMFQGGLKIRTLHVRDIRFPTSLGAHGTDAMHVDCNYSAAYVIIYTEGDVEGHGLTFTIGHGNEIVCAAVKSMAPIVVGMDASDIYDDFAGFWRKLTSHSQLRWVGPEKGVIHLATAAIVNALWDLWANLEHKPLWKLLVDMEPEKLVSTIDFRYISDVITKEEAIKILKAKQNGKEDREELMKKVGYPAYTTQAGWLGYSSDRVEQLCKQYLANGFTAFKLKVGQNLEDDILRCEMVRKVIGWDNYLMVDANQVWDVPQAIEWMKHLAPFKPLWIEEPTSPDDILGHAAISKALKPLGIGVATGEMCCNRVMFKQFLQAEAMQFCQIDSCRIGGVNEILSVYLMAHKLGVPVCPHAGGVGLCEMVQHLQIWDYISVSGTTEGRMVEYVNQQHEHFENPTIIRHAHYIAPSMPGYSTVMIPQSAEDYEYPHGSKWEEMFSKGLFPDPRKQNVYVTSEAN